MLLGHVMFHHKEALVLHRFDGDPVCFIDLFGFQRRQGNAAADSNSFTHGVDDVAADRADVNFGTQHIGGNILIGDNTTCSQFFKEERFNGWVIGEIYIINNALNISI